MILQAQVLRCLLGVQPPMVFHGPLLMGIPDGLGSAEGAQPPQTLLTPNWLRAVAVHAGVLAPSWLNSCNIIINANANAICQDVGMVWSVMWWCRWLTECKTKWYILPPKRLAHFWSQATKISCLDSQIRSWLKMVSRFTLFSSALKR